ncbi:MAG: hypothetical protein HND47_00930 [Chloroflexi bacterium]|nr:hypothetical protein [Chloroflexota bacterium]
MTKKVRDLQEKKREAGRLGGLATVKKHGVDHMRSIGVKGAHVFHSRYRLTPVGTSQFVIVHRETGEVKNFLDGSVFQTE